MSPNVIKIGIRALASIAALIGITGLVFDLTIFLPSSIAAGDAFGIGFWLFGILLGVYLTYVGYLGWCRFSPRSVRHILCAVALALLCLASSLLDRYPQAPPYLFLGAIILCYAFYRFAASICCRRLFRDAPERLTQQSS
jgi:hypothetical protein